MEHGCDADAGGPRKVDRGAPPAYYGKAILRMLADRRRVHIDIARHPCHGDGSAHSTRQPGRERARSLRDMANDETRCPGVAGMPAHSDQAFLILDPGGS